MTPEHLDKLFKPFSQVDPSATRRFGGSGPGAGDHPPLLPGDGRATSGSRAQPGVGSTFTIRLPAVVGAAGRPAARVGQPPAQLRPGPAGDTVLVIDDDPATREVLGQFLDEEGVPGGDRGQRGGGAAPGPAAPPGGRSPWT